MRAINFRAWDTRTNKWAEDFAIGTSTQSPHEVQSFPVVAPVVFNGQGKCVLMQFTGLLDKKGKEIYEGDVLDWGDNFNSKVYWDEETASFRIEELGIAVWKGEKYPRTHDLNSYTYTATIKGNIYENPSLLTHTKE